MDQIPNRIFVSGIGTGVGKTIASAVLVEALQADYWKPIQCGGLEDTDTMVVRSLVSNGNSKFHAEAYRLKTASSPHYAAQIEGVEITIPLSAPATSNRLIIEGAGGLLVPISQGELVIDIPRKLKLPVVLIASNYLGSINHTLLSIEALKNRGIELLGLIFNGDGFLDNEAVIQHFGGVKVLGNITRTDNLDKRFIFEQAQQLKHTIANNFIL